MIVRVLGVTKTPRAIRGAEKIGGMQVLLVLHEDSLQNNAVLQRLWPHLRKGATPGTSAGRAFVRSTVLLGKTVRPRYSRSNWIRCLSIVLNTFAHPTVAP